MQQKTNTAVFIKSTGLALLCAWATAADAAVDYSLLTAPVNVNEVVDINQVQQLNEAFSFTTEGQFVTAVDNNLFTYASIYQLAGVDPYASASFNIVGGSATLITQQGSSSIQMTSAVPLFNQTFNGTTRIQSSHLLKQWLDANAGLIQPSFQSPVNKPSPLNPIYGAGPGSPVSLIPSTDMSIDINGGLGNRFLSRGSSAQGDDLDNRVSVATRFSNYCADQQCARFYSVPIGYVKELSNEWALLFKLPLTYIDSAGTSSYSVSLSSGVRVPVSHYLNLGRFKWDLIPLFSIGGVGSDLPGTQTSLVYAGGLQSNFGFPIGNGYSLVIQNQYNHFITTSAGPFVVNGATAQTDLINDVYRNGVQLAKDFNYKLFGRAVIASLFFADTRFSGDVLAINNQQEIGFDIGLKASTASSLDFNIGDVASVGKIKKKIKSEIAANDIKLGVTYTRAKNIDDAFSVNLGWTF